MTDPPITEPLPAPEILADGFASACVANGVAKLAYFSLHRDAATGENQRRVVLRLAVPLIALVGIHAAIGDMLAQIEQAAKEHGDA